VALSNLTQRILVAVVAIPLILLIAFAGGVYFFVLVALIAALALGEFYSLAKAKGAFPQTAVGLLFGFCINMVFLFDKLHRAVLGFVSASGLEVPLPSMTQLFLIVVLLFVPFILLVELFRNKGSAIMNVAMTALGVSYVSLFLGCFIGIRELFVPADFPVFRYFAVHGASMPEEVVKTVDRWGALTVISVLASIWLCDTAAFHVGKVFGKHKLFSRVSPNKTWEGAIAGFIFAMVTFVAAKYLVLPYLPLASAIVCGAIVGVFGQLGDLVESLLKRDAGVKDSSTLIPGHGGVLDRFDSLLFVSPLVYLYLDFIVF
jgi:phosphatidate cytidylyltransferase